MTVVAQEVGQAYVEVKANGVNKDVLVQAAGAASLRVVVDGSIPTDNDTEAYFIINPRAEYPTEFSTARVGTQGVYVRADRRAGTTKAVWNVEP